jgi:diacylglycerol kinase family enzyme
MEAHLIYNPNAAHTARVAPQEILEGLLSAGYDPVYRPTLDPDDLDRVLEAVEGLVVVAGGDGSVRGAVRRLVGRPVKLTILPLGGANNVATSLGIEGPVDALLAGLADPQPRSFDVGRVRLPGREICFLEAVGCGLFSNAFAAFHVSDGQGHEQYERGVRHAIEALLAALETNEPFHIRATVDGETFEGPVLALEVLNTPLLGPNLELAAEADPGDRLLDVVRVGPDGWEEVSAYVRRLLEREVGELPSVESIRGEEVRLAWTGLPLHVDARVVPVEEGEEISVTCDLYPQPIDVWVPGAREGQ